MPINEKCPVCGKFLPKGQWIHEPCLPKYSAPKPERVYFAGSSVSDVGDIDLKPKRKPSLLDRILGRH